MYLLLLLLVLTFILYRRYLPFVRLDCIDLKDINANDVVVLDVRDYQTSSKYPINNCIVMPLAYLRRYVKDLKGKRLVIVGNTRSDIKWASRFLKGKGIQIIGFYLLQENNHISCCGKEIMQ